MTNIEIAEKTIASLTDKRDRAVQRSSEIAATRQALGYAVHVDDNKAARERLDKANADMAFIAGEVEGIDAALAEANARLAAARSTAGRAADAEHRQKVHWLLTDLEKCAPELDEGVGSLGYPHTAAPADGRLRYYQNPPLQQRVGDLVGALLIELRALGLATHKVDQFDIGRGGHKVLIEDIKLVPSNWAAFHRDDLKKELTSAIQKYQRGSLSGDQRHSFKALIDGFAEAVRADIAQTNIEVAA